MENKNSIEGLGIVAINESMLVTGGYLIANLVQQDKMPSWDGHIDIYSNATSKKNGLKQVYAQVKGHSIDYSIKKYKKNSETIQEVAQVEDLTNYLHNHGGAIYFSVYINKDHPYDRTIYYNTLTVIKLKKYLKGVKSDGSKTITLKRFPIDNEKKLFILSNFFEDCKRQASFCDQGIIRIEDIENMEEVTSITSSVIAHGCDNSLEGVIQAFLKNETYFYATIKGSDALLPIDTWGQFQSMSYVNNTPVAIGAVEYYENIIVGHTLEDRYITIGESVKISFKPAKNNQCATSMYITLSNSLRHRYKDMRFLLDAYQAGSFKVGDVPLLFNSTEIEKEYFTSDRKKELDMYKSIVDTFDRLHIKNDLQIDTITDNEWKELINISNHFDCAEKIGHNNKLLRKDVCDDNKIHKFIIKVQNITFYLFGRKYKDKMYLYDLINLPDLIIRNDATNTTSAIQSILSAHDYITISNISYDKVLPSYEYASKMGDICYERVNYNVLSLLNAYDKTSNIEILNTAKKLIIWLLDRETINIPLEILQVNLLQIIKRERILNKNEETQLAEIGDSSNNNMVKVAAHLLLDNMAMARHYYSKLEETEQENMKLWPIYKFWIE